MENVRACILVIIIILQNEMKSMEIVDYINMHLLKRLFTSVNILNASSMLLVFTTYRAASCDKKFNLILACNITEYEITPPYLANHQSHKHSKHRSAACSATAPSKTLSFRYIYLN